MSVAHKVAVVVLAAYGAVAVAGVVAFAAGALVRAWRRRRRAGRRGGLLEFDSPAGRDAVAGWTCMVCGRYRPDRLIDVASRTVGWVTMNVRYCSDSDSCRVAAEERAASEAVRLGSAT